MILDEPPAGLDPAGREGILGCLKALKEERGMGILLVSHSMEDVAACADRILVLRAGELILDGTPAEIFRHTEELQQAELAIPEVCRLMRMLKDRGLAVDTDALSVESARRSIMKLFEAEQC